MPDLPHARAFLAQLIEIMPPGYRLRIDGDLLRLSSPNGRRSGSSPYWLTTERLSEREALSGALQSLDQIQQEIAEDTTDPWPAQSGPGNQAFPEPDGELVGDQLRLWFGKRDAPVLVLKAIDLGGVIVHD